VFERHHKKPRREKNTYPLLGNNRKKQESNKGLRGGRGKKSNGQPSRRWDVLRRQDGTRQSAESST